jgi:hypothetical protein
MASLTYLLGQRKTACRRGMPQHSKNESDLGMRAMSQRLHAAIFSNETRNHDHHLPPDLPEASIHAVWHQSCHAFSATGKTEAKIREWGSRRCRASAENQETGFIVILRPALESVAAIPWEFLKNRQQAGA